ncbi:MAG TPA: hypothetical protein VHB77_09460 [Planctomycetaceae bacterium]|nr:hypothetical protein [Planctomycetaceae bacterium]
MKLAFAWMSPAMLVFPLAAVAVIVWASGPGLSWFTAKYGYTGKDLQEVLGPTVLCAAALLSGYFAWQQRSFANGWLCLLAGCFACREFHFPGTHEGVFVVAALLMWLGLQRIDDLAPLLRRRWAYASLCGAIAIYALTVSVDHGAWKFLPNWRLWGTNVEESLETFGHVVFLLSVLLTGFADFNPESAAAKYRSRAGIRR